MDHTDILVGLFLAALDRNHHALLFVGREQETINDFETVRETIESMVLEIDKDERQEWIDCVLKEGAIPVISSFNFEPSLALV